MDEGLVMMRDGKTVMLALSVYKFAPTIAFALRSTPTIPEDMRAAADNWNHFEEVTDRTAERMIRVTRFIAASRMWRKRNGLRCRKAIN